MRISSSCSVVARGISVLSLCAYRPTSIITPTLPPTGSMFRYIRVGPRIVASDGSSLFCTPLTTPKEYVSVGCLLVLCRWEGTFGPVVQAGFTPVSAPGAARCLACRAVPACWRAARREPGRSRPCPHARAEIGRITKTPERYFVAE